jgi:hypothetical protein
VVTVTSLRFLALLRSLGVMDLSKLVEDVLLQRLFWVLGLD